MALNPSGPISLGGTTAGQSIAIENGGPGTATISLNDAPVRSLAGVPSGTIIMPTDFYGKSNSVTINLVISGNTQNYDIYANRGPTYVPGISNLTVTVNPGVFVGSTSTGAYAMLVPSAFSPTDNVTIINNGTVLGAGAGGGAGVNGPGTPNTGGTGGTGGNAIYVNRPTTITNNGAIYSGGGGGGGSSGIDATGGPIKAPTVVLNGGGGGGGGGGFNAGGGGAGGNFGPGGNFGAPGAPGGTLTGGAGGLAATGGWTGARPQGGSGGGVGAGGAAGVSQPSAPNIGTPGGGGGTGFYLVGNPFVTWPAFGTRAGNVS
jgi:hypothetical protein